MRARDDATCAFRMVRGFPRLRLADWTAELGPLASWLEGQAAEGWRPEYGVDGVEVTLHGRIVRRFAMIKQEPPTTSSGAETTFRSGMT